MVLTLVQQEVEFTTAHRDKDMMAVQVQLAFRLLEAVAEAVVQVQSALMVLVIMVVQEA